MARGESDGIWSGKAIDDIEFTKSLRSDPVSPAQDGVGTELHDARWTIGVARSFQTWWCTSRGGEPVVQVYVRKTAIFMVKLVRNMRKTMVAEALRQTILEMRREYPDP